MCIDESSTDSAPWPEKAATSSVGVSSAPQRATHTRLTGEEDGRLHLHSPERAAANHKAPCGTTEGAPLFTVEHHQQTLSAI